MTGIVLAAIDNSAAARPVLATAAAVAELFGADPVAIHARGDGAQTAGAAARQQGMELREATGRADEALLAAGAERDVVAVVVGARRSAGGRRPAGRTALEVITRLRKPVIVVPPHARPADRIRCVCVPLDGTEETAAALRETIELARGAGVEVVALHVLTLEQTPAFGDQIIHEAETWSREFLHRALAHLHDGVRLETRVGAPSNHVPAVAHEVEADLLVLGWRQDLSPGRAEVVRQALSRSDVPILLVPVGNVAEQPLR